VWQVVKRDHGRLIRAAGAERFALDRLCLDDDMPLSSEVERVRAALGRVAVQIVPAPFFHRRAFSTDRRVSI
jgi:hypothetical protein